MSTWTSPFTTGRSSHSPLGRALLALIVHHRWTHEPHLLHAVYHEMAWLAMLTNYYLVVSYNKQKFLMVLSIKRNYHQAMDLWVLEADFG
jgi:hypothetical protein